MRGIWMTGSLNLFLQDRIKQRSLKYNKPKHPPVRPAVPPSSNPVYVQVEATDVH